MQQLGKFILMDIMEFKVWLLKQNIKRKIQIIQIHHTWQPSYKNFSKNYFQLLRGMEDSHIKRGFNQIAQNITIFPDGIIAVCRPIDIIPAGIKGANEHGICIENIGNFDKEKINKLHSEVLVQTVALLLQKYKLPANTNTVVYHHWYDLNTGLRLNGKGCTKTCPGILFFGGNTVDACNKNFMPLIIKQLNTPVTFAAEDPKQILQTINKKGIIDPFPYSTLSALVYPANDAKACYVFAKGAKVNIYGLQNGFYLVNKLTPQWVSAKYVKFI